MVSNAHEADFPDFVGDVLEGVVGHLGAKGDGKEKKCIGSVLMSDREIRAHLSKAQLLRCFKWG
jgi:hypothetical protein